jgi:hypothetical protein
MTWLDAQIEAYAQEMEGQNDGKTGSGDAARQIQGIADFKAFRR